MCPIPRFALALFLPATAAPLAAQTMVNQHVSSAGVQATWEADNDRPSISDDDRYVAFASAASNLVAGDSNGMSDVFVHDNLTGATVLISLDTAGGPTDGESRRPWLSGTGRYVAFQSTATDLVAGASGVQVYRRDRDTDADGIFDEPGATATIVVSVSSAGVLGDGPSRSYTLSISDDGDRIAFESEATNLVGGDTNASEDCFVRTVSAGATERVSISTGGAQASFGAQAPAISGDGSTVAFYSVSPTLIDGGGDANGVYDVFVRDMAAGTTELASVDDSGVQGNGGSLRASVSDDGDRVAFESDATNLVGGDTNGATDVFVRDRGAATTIRVSVAGGGTPSGGGYDAFVAGDGSVVAFISSAADLVPGDGNGEQDAFVHRTATVDTVRASRAVDGTQSNGFSADVSLSDDGSHVGFRSYATNLLAGGDTNGFGDILLRGEPFLGPADGSSAEAAATEGPVTFSVNGPVDPHTEGIRYPRGLAPTPQVPLQPGNPAGYCVRAPAVPIATGIATIWPGDVFDYGPPPSEAVMFQSPPLLPPGPIDPVPPDGTDNQALEAMGMGLVAGPPVAAGLWTAVPPMAPARDDVDAFSFGEDYFPPMLALGFATEPPLPLPPLDTSGEIVPDFTTWTARLSSYAEPIVTDDAPGVSFRFSVDPWALGLAGTAVDEEAGAPDAGAVCAGWMSDGQAAGDVFGTSVLTRVASATTGGGANAVVDDEESLALLGPVPPAIAAEDHLDALEIVGDNTSPWFGGPMLRPGDLAARLVDVPPFGPPAPGVSSSEPSNDAPVFFSVTRNSVGEPFSAVRSQFVIDGGAAADIFVAVKNPLDPAGDGFNLLFADESELGLYAMSAPPFGTSPADWGDDLDALVLWVCPEMRAAISMEIDLLLATMPWAPYGTGDALTGPGMTVSIVSLLAGTIPEDCIRVGFSVTTDSIGLEYTAVDWEAAPVDVTSGPYSTAAGDVFYAELDGDPANSNYLWYEEVDLGLDAGTWTNGASMDLGELADNLTALDSIFVPAAGAAFSTYCTAGTTSNGCNASIDGVGTPSASGATPFSIVVAGTEGARQGLIFYGLSGPAAAPWGAGTSLLCVAPPRQRTGVQMTGGTDGACDGYLGLDWNTYLAANPGALGAPFAAGDTAWAQGWFRDPPSPKGTHLSNGLRLTFIP